MNGTVTLNDLSRQLESQKTTVETLRTNLEALQGRINKENQDFLDRLEKFKGSPQYDDIKAELESHHKSNLAEIRALKAQINAILGGNDYLAEVRTVQGKRPMWSYIAQAILDAGRPMKSREIADTITKMGYETTAKDPIASVQFTLGHTDCFNYTGGRQNGGVEWYVVQEKLPKSGESKPPTVQGTKVIKVTTPSTSKNSTAKVKGWDQLP